MANKNVPFLVLTAKLYSDSWTLVGTRPYHPLRKYCFDDV